MPERDIGNMRVNLSFTPSYTYTRADCPQYAGLKGPSCFTAPLVPTRPELPDVLLPQNYQPPKDLMPPPGTVLGPNGNLVAVGPPLINPNPSLADPNPPLPPWIVALTAGAGNGQSGVGADTASAGAAVTPGASGAQARQIRLRAAGSPPHRLLPAEAAPASFGGNVGPVGSAQERLQLGSSPANRRRRPPSCCSARSRAARRCRCAEPARSAR